MSAWERPAALAALSMLAGCVSWTVITASGPPSALQGKTNYTVDHDWSGLQIDGMTESEWLGSKREKATASWQGDRAAMEELIVTTSNRDGSPYRFVPGDGGEVQVTVEWRTVTPGYFASIASRMTTTVANVRFAIGGSVVDEISIFANFQHDISTPTTGQGVRFCARVLGGKIRRFVESVNGG